jgi:hypothetical protein
MAQMEVYLLSKHKALSSNDSTAKKKKKIKVFAIVRLFCGHTNFLHGYFQ